MSFVASEQTGIEAPVLAAILQENDYALDNALASGADPNQSVSGWSALHAAASRGNVQWTKKLLQNGANPNISNNDGRVPLTEAISEGHLNVVKELLLAGANPNVKDNNGETPLQLASTKGNLQIVSVLLTSKADPSVKNSIGATPLFYAAAFGYVDIVELLIENGADPQVETHQGITPLFEAAISGNRKLVELLLHHGVSANSKTKEGWTALHNAAKFGHVDVIELLIKNGANVNAVENGAKRTPLFLACSDGNADSVVLLLENGADPNIKAEGDNYPIHAAVSVENMKMVQSLVENGANVNVRDLDGGSPLNRVANNGNAPIARYLLESGAEPNAGTFSRRFYPLLVACARGAHQVVKVLLEFGADHRLTSFERTTAIHAAAMEGHANIVEILLNVGADPNTVDSKGWSTMHNAIQGGHIDVVRVLLNHNVDPNISHNGVLPVTLAAILKHPDIVELLAVNGADLNRSDNAGWTPVLHMSGAGEVESLRTILRYGANVNVRNHNGESAIQIAQIHNHHTDILHVLYSYGANLDDMDVGKWLTAVGFEDLKDSFAENQITGSILPFLTTDILKNELGVTKLGLRIKLEAALAPFKAANKVHSHDEL